MNEINGKYIINKIRSEEKQAQRRMYLFSLIPIALTILLMGICWQRINKATNDVKKLGVKRDSLQTIIDSQKDSLTQIRKAYEFALTYRDKSFSFDYSIDKEMFSVYPRQTAMLSEIRELIGGNRVKWHLGGKSVVEGFDSPSFAWYILNKFSNTQVSEKDIYNIHSILDKTDNPEVGDIVFYEHGYTMFYFRYHGEPFCVGMTPVGVASLKLDFGPKIISFGKVQYH